MMHEAEKENIGPKTNSQNIQNALIANKHRTVTKPTNHFSLFRTQPSDPVESSQLKEHRRKQYNKVAFNLVDNTVHAYEPVVAIVDTETIRDANIWDDDDEEDDTGSTERRHIHTDPVVIQNTLHNSQLHDKTLPLPPIAPLAAKKTNSKSRTHHFRINHRSLLTCRSGTVPPVTLIVTSSLRSDTDHTSITENSYAPNTPNIRVNDSVTERTETEPSTNDTTGAVPIPTGEEALDNNDNSNGADRDDEDNEDNRNDEVNEDNRNDGDNEDNEDNRDNEDNDDNRDNEDDQATVLQDDHAHYTMEQRIAMMEFCTTTGIIVRDHDLKMGVANDKLKSFHLDQVGVEINDFYAHKFKKSVKDDIILPAQPWLFREILKVKLFQNLWTRITVEEVLLQEALDSGLNPVQQYVDELKLCLEIRQLHQTDSPLKEKALSQMKVGIKKKINRLFVSLASNIYGQVHTQYLEDQSTARRLARGAEEADEDGEQEEAATIVAPQTTLTELGNDNVPDDWMDAILRDDDDASSVASLPHQATNSGLSSRSEDIVNTSNHSANADKTTSSSSSQLDTLLEDEIAVDVSTVGDALLDWFPYHDYCDSRRCVKLRFTEFTPLALALDGNESVPPQHITCIIGTEMEVALSLCYVIKLTQCQIGKMKDLRSLTLLLPTTYADKPQEFVRIISSCMPNDWNCDTLPLKYAGGDLRHLVVCTRGDVVSSTTDLEEDLKTRIKLAYDRAGQIFKSLPGGVHALPLDVVYKLICAIDVRHGDNSWDIGCGDNRLSSSLSVAAGGSVVICTDTQRTVELLVIAADAAKKVSRHGASHSKRKLVPSITPSPSVFLSTSPTTCSDEDDANDVSSVSSGSSNSSVSKRRRTLQVIDSDDE